MRLRQRQVGSRAGPRRVGDPGIVLLALGLAVGCLALGASALTDGREVQGLVGVGLAVALAAWVASLWRERRRARR